MASSVCEARVERHLKTKSEVTSYWKSGKEKICAIGDYSVGRHCCAYLELIDKAANDKRKCTKIAGRQQ